MYRDFRVFDCDSHFMEPPDLWDKHFPQELWDRRPIGSADRGSLDVDGCHYPTLRWSRMASLNDEWASAYGKYDRLGWNPEAYFHAMEDQGIDVMMLYPSRGLMQVAPWGLDPKLAAEVVKAYNSWVHDFVVQGEGRLFGVGQVDLRDVDAAVLEARRCVQELGLRAVYILPENPLPGVTLDRAYYDPLWSAIEDLGVPLVLHNVAGTGLGQLAADRFGGWSVPRIAFSFPLESQVALFQFLMGGVCERHPRLKVLVTESGAGWLPYWLWFLDELAERYGASDLPALSMAPSDYFRQNFFISAEMEEPTLKYVVDFLGTDNIVTASDFPHPEGTFPDGVREFCDRDDLSDETKRKILWDNPIRLYGEA
jgi:uncharacterized protein